MTRRRGAARLSAPGERDRRTACRPWRRHKSRISAGVRGTPKSCLPTVPGVVLMRSPAKSRVVAWPGLRVPEGTPLVRTSRHRLGRLGSVPVEGAASFSAIRIGASSHSEWKKA